MKKLILAAALLMAAPAGAHVCSIKEVVIAKSGVRIFIGNSRLYLMRVTRTEDGGYAISGGGHRIHGRMIFIPNGSRFLINDRVSFEGCLIYSEKRKGTAGLAYQIVMHPPFAPMPVQPLPIEFIPASRSH